MKRFQFAAVAIVPTLLLATAWSQQPQQRPAPTGQLQLQSPGAARAEQVPAAGKAQPPATATAPVPGLTTDKQKTSYGLGLSIGSQMRETQLTPDDLDTQALLRGLTDALKKAEPAVSEQELKQCMMNFQKEMVGRMQDRVKTVGDKNKKDGAAFLAANKAKEGVKTTPSGLQYKIIKSGTGASPAAADTASVNYKGTLIDGTVFDSSDAHGGPASFEVDQVIPGWTEALKMMKVGDKWQLVIPSELAYGERAMGSDIPPNSVLLFDVELLDVKKGSAAQPR